MDIELLFSNSPFVQQNLGNFAYIMPNHQEIIELKKDQSSTDIGTGFWNYLMCLTI